MGDLVKQVLDHWNMSKILSLALNAKKCGGCVSGKTGQSMKIGNVITNRWCQQNQKLYHKIKLDQNPYTEP